MLGTEFLGGYTTFATWMVASERLGEIGDVVVLLAYIFLSLLLGFVSQRSLGTSDTRLDDQRGSEA